MCFALILARVHGVGTANPQAFCVSERFQPPEQGSTFLKVKGREAWVVQRAESDGEEACKKLPPPMDEVGHADTAAAAVYCRQVESLCDTQQL